VRAFTFTPEGCATTKLTLSITKIGSGTLTSSPAGINWGSDCSEPYTSGAVITLNVIAATGCVFAGWGGDPDCADSSVTMDGSKRCIATFTAAPQTFILNVNLVKAMSSAGTGNAQ